MKPLPPDDLPPVRLALATALVHALLSAGDVRVTADKTPAQIAATGLSIADELIAQAQANPEGTT